MGNKGLIAILLLLLAVMFSLFGFVLNNNSLVPYSLLVWIIWIVAAVLWILGAILGFIRFLKFALCD